MLNLFKKHIFKNNHYSGIFLDPENWWCISAQFEKFDKFGVQQRSGLLDWKKDLKISYVLDFFYVLTYYCLYPAYKISKKCMIGETAGGAKTSFR